MRVRVVFAFLGRYVRELRAAVEALRQALSAPGEPPPGLAVAARTVEEATRRHLTVLEGLLGRVPEQARAVLQHALAERAGTGGKPENTGRPGGTPGGPPEGAPGGPGGGRGRP